MKHPSGMNTTSKKPSSSTANLCLIRHGQSVWNKDNRFTGWVDVELTEKGLIEATQAGQLLTTRLDEKNIQFDQVFTSVLKRSIQTYWNIAKEMDQCWLPTTAAWQLNERHYGALQGLNKQETRDKYGDEQVHIWRRSYSTPPPLLGSQKLGSQKLDSQEVDSQEEDQIPSYFKSQNNDLPTLPLGESLEMTSQRVLPYWESIINPLLSDGQNILIVAHGNSIRALIKEIEGLSDDAITKVEVPTGEPIIYEFSYDLPENRVMISKEVLKKLT